ncbi:hypothetical protein [Mycobacterium sp. TY815]|uniref:hypothetical protein n=1 Tax=Mycobacterium sp. TY815 TaxID=3050581 RepID=UPI002741167F|nr:hypothetical protein [Mycobacterium sp. TY815]MDP7701395.1 hypothetical protein [Mycobacterium sp. TY815]
MSNDEPENLPVRRSGELVIAVSEAGLLVDGDPGAVESFIDRIQSAAGHVVDTAGVTKGAVGNLAGGLAVGAASAFAQSGQFVQLSAKSMEAIRTGNLIPGDPGFFRMTTVGSGGQFLQQLQWRPVSLGPTQMMSVQMIAIQMALKMAIAEVNESIKRVEGKVESVLKLAEADRIGDVRGQYATVVRMTRNLDRTGVLPATDWQSVAALGPDLIIVVEKLRAHVERTLDDFDASKPVQERADVLKRAVEEKSIGETLNLLVLAEESLNNWQRLRIARVQDVEPEHRQHVVDDAFDLLATQVAQDGALYQRATEVLETYRKTKAIDGFRYWSVRDIAKHSKTLKEDLDAFARARRHQLEEWQELAVPSIGDAASHVLGVASDQTDRAIEAAGQSISKAYNYFAGDGTEKTREAIRRRIARERAQSDEKQAEDGKSKAHDD